MNHTYPEYWPQYFTATIYQWKHFCRGWCSLIISQAPISYREAPWRGFQPATSKLEKLQWNYFKLVL